VYGFDKSDLELITSINNSEYVVALDKPVSFLDKHQKWCIRRHKHNRLRGDVGMIVFELIFRLWFPCKQMKVCRVRAAMGTIVGENVLMGGRGAVLTRGEIARSVAQMGVIECMAVVM
jgi:hypothetical protein